MRRDFRSTWNTIASSAREQICSAACNHWLALRELPRNVVGCEQGKICGYCGSVAPSEQNSRGENWLADAQDAALGFF